MASPWKDVRCCCRAWSLAGLFFVFVSASIAKETTDDGVVPEQRNSSFLLTYQNSTASSLAGRRRTGKWRPEFTDYRPTISAVQNDVIKTQTVPNTSPLKYRDVIAAILNATTRSSSYSSTPSSYLAQQQQPWTIRPRPKTKSDLTDVLTSANPTRTGRVAMTKTSTSPQSSQRLSTAQRISEDARKTDIETEPSSLTSSAITNGPDSTDTSQKNTKIGTDHMSEYEYSEEEGEEDEENDYDDDEYEDDEEDDDDESYADDYYDEEYDEDDGVMQQDPSEYEGNEYHDTVHHSVRGGNMRMPYNYTDPGSREIRRLVIGGKSSSQIDMSLLVIYAWLGLVVIMIAITALIFKYKQQLSARCLQVTSSCRKVRQVIGIEEGNNLLAHPLV